MQSSMLLMFLSVAATAVTLAAGVINYPFAGCYKANDDNRVLSHTADESDFMTQEFCQQSCTNRNYKYFGMRLGRKCYCGNTVHGGERIPNMICMWPCTGNPRQSCGSDVAMQVFVAGGLKTPVSNPTSTTPTTHWTTIFRCTSTSSGMPVNTGGNKPSMVTAAPRKPTNTPDSPITIDDSQLGCYVSHDSNNALRQRVAEGQFMTQALCRRKCFALSYKYFGLKSGRLCYCGNAIYSGIRVEQDRCAMRCGGDVGQTCGGAGTMQILQCSSHGTAPVNPLSGTGQSLPTVYLGTTTTPLGSAAPSAVTPGVKFRECYMSDNNNDALRHRALEGDFMTSSVCRKICSNRSYAYFGLRSSTKCYCDSHLTNALIVVQMSRCSWKCKGNPKEMCGSDTAMLVYNTF